MRVQVFLKKKFLKRLIIHYFKTLPPEAVSGEQKEVIRYLSSNKLTVFPYSFTKKYKPADIQLFKDKKHHLLYTMYHGKRLYYKDGVNTKKAQRYFNSIFMEQDMDSPHRYLTKDFDVQNNDIVVDVGAAEGNFALDVVEKVKKLYLFEPQIIWHKALKATFEPWKDKIHLIPKLVSDRTDEISWSLDDFFQQKDSFDLLKIDVEGSEKRILKGLENTLQKGKNTRIVVCTYHRQHDEKELSELLKNKGFSTHCSKGYMIFRNGIEKPYLRRGVLKALKLT